MTLATTQSTFRVTERGHLTDRYTKAIEQLGHDSIAIRLGGIYALQQLAVDTSRDSDQATVVEVLSAFVRLNLHARTEKTTGDGEHDTTSAPPADPSVTDPGPTAAEEPAPLDGASDPETVQSREPRADVLAAISVLAQLPARDGVPMRADFIGLDFRGIDLSHARFARAHLKRVQFAGANLTNANLTNAYLTHANLTNADLTHADLTDANLTNARLTGANLTNANLHDARLTGANLTGARLANARLTNARLTGASLLFVDLRGANLCNANLTDARLTYAYLMRADLTGAGLASADLVSVKRPGFSGGSVLPRAGVLGWLADGSRSVPSRPAECCRSWSAIVGG